MGLRSGSFVLEFVFLLCKKIKLLTCVFVVVVVVV